MRKTRARPQKCDMAADDNGEEYFEEFIDKVNFENL